MSIKKPITGWLHLWLGLSSGLVVFIVSITGCIYAFEKEIRDYTQPYQYVKPQTQPYLAPSRLRVIAARSVLASTAAPAAAAPGQAAPAKRIDSMAKAIQGIAYGTADKSAIAAYTDKTKGFTAIYINPYTGEVLHKKVFSEDFFRIVLAGHFYLWLPPKIGAVIVDIAVLIFLVLLITGMILWWPKNLKKANAQKSFTIKWNARFKRVNYDLHNVFGFYVLLIAFMIAATGLTWSFQWFAQSVHWVASGGKRLDEFKRPFSDTTKKAVAALPTTASAAPPTTAIAPPLPPEDQLWQQLLREDYGGKGTIQLQFPLRKTDPYAVYYNPDEGKTYRRFFRFFDRTTMEEIKGGGVLGHPIDGSSTADKIYRMNYDLHTGSILGLPGKIIAFFASLICASLPVTGFLVWWGKKKKKKAPA